MGCNFCFGLTTSKFVSDKSDHLIKPATNTVSELFPTVRQSAFGPPTKEELKRSPKSLAEAGLRPGVTSLARTTDAEAMSAKTRSGRILGDLSKEEDVYVTLG